MSKTELLYRTLQFLETQTACLYAFAEGLSDHSPNVSQAMRRRAATWGIEAAVIQSELQAEQKADNATSTVSDDSGT